MRARPSRHLVSPDQIAVHQPLATLGVADDIEIMSGQLGPTTRFSDLLIEWLRALPRAARDDE